MSIKHVIYNPFAGDRESQKRVWGLKKLYPNADFCYTDITTIDDYETFLNTVSQEEDLIICGGDGTLNRFANAVYHLNISNDIYYYAIGTGNDFLRDLSGSDVGDPILINPYIQDLPTVTVNGKSYRFINGVGFGIDGYCCEVGDRMKAKGKIPNYTAIAITGLLFKYKPTTATVTIDGKTRRYKKIWIAPTMNGRYYGGGMMAAPNQNRGNIEGTVSFVAMHTAGKLKTLLVFSSIFKGEHIKHKEMVDEIQGHQIVVEFDRPVALQIDGETILNVTRYEVSSKKSVIKEKY